MIDFAIRPVDLAADAVRLHEWLAHPKSEFWMMRDATVADVLEELRPRAGKASFVGLYGSRPEFLVQRYDPAIELAGIYAVEPGDVGMHFLVAPTDHPVHGFTRAVIVSIMTWIFCDPSAERVVVEPDVRNTAVYALNRFVGFRVAATISLPDKAAHLSFCTRKDFEATR